MIADHFPMNKQSISFCQSKIENCIAGVFVPFVKNIPVFANKVPSHPPCSRIQSYIADYAQSVLRADLLLVQGILKTPDKSKLGVLEQLSNDCRN